MTARTCMCSPRGTVELRGAIATTLVCALFCCCSAPEPCNDVSYLDWLDISSNAGSVDRVDVDGPCSLVPCPGTLSGDAGLATCVEHSATDGAACTIAVVFDVPGFPTQQCSFEFITGRECNGGPKYSEIVGLGTDSRPCCMTRLDQGSACKNMPIPWQDAGSADGALGLESSIEPPAQGAEED